MKRKGFTLIELAVAMAILVVLICMALGGFAYVGTMARSQQSSQASLQNMSAVLDQVTKELRQCVTQTSAHAPFTGMGYPGSSATRDIASILDASSPAPGDGSPYIFDPSKGPILQFYSMGDDGIYRISYTLGVPSGGGLQQRYWPNPAWQPCEVLYTRERWTDSDGDWVVDSGELTTIVSGQPVTDQVITNFTVIRPAWSDKVIQVVISGTVKDASGNARAATRIAQITVRQ